MLRTLFPPPTSTFRSIFLPMCTSANLQIKISLTYGLVSTCFTLLMGFLPLIHRSQKLFKPVPANESRTVLFRAQVFRRLFYCQIILTHRAYPVGFLLLFD